MSLTASVASSANPAATSSKLTLLQSTIKQLAAMQRGYLGGLVGDIPDVRMAEQFPNVVNHPAWHIGHLAVSADQCIEIFGGKRRLDDATWAKFGMGSKPIADRSAYPSKAECLAMLDERRDALLAAIVSTSADRLTTANPIPSLATQIPTLADLATFLMLTHEGMHFGQLSTWRKAAGLKGLMEKS